MVKTFRFPVFVHLPEGREVMIVAIVDAELIVDVEVSVEPAAREKIKVRAARSWGLAIEKMVSLVELSLCLSRAYLGKTIVSSIKMAHKKGVFRTPGHRGQNGQTSPRWNCS